jgi:tetratricopeptide (TPR) repeat protein
VRRGGVLSALLPGVGGAAQQPEDATPDARIRYYQGRLGGPSTYPAHARLGLAYAEKARATGRVSFYLEAGRFLERSLSWQRNYEALLGLSGVSLALHRLPEALAYAREAFETMPGDPAAQGALFDALLGSGDHRAAERSLETLGTRGSFGRLLREAALHEYRGQTAEALLRVEQACALPEASTAPVATRAWCQLRQGALQLALCRSEAARSAYQRALRMFPGYPLAREHLAELDAAEGNTQQAVSSYARQLANAAEPHQRLALADLHDSAHEPRRAEEERGRARSELLERAAEDVRDAWHELALLEAADPKTAGEAVRWAKLDWENRKDVHAAEALAWSWSQHGNPSKAEEALQSALAPGGASASLLLRGALDVRYCDSQVPATVRERDPQPKISGEFGTSRGNSGARPIRRDPASRSRRPPPSRGRRGRSAWRGRPSRGTA